MPVELYTLSGSPFAWRAQLALEIKGAPYVVHVLSVADRQNRTPEFLALSPRGKVPVLVDGDFVLTESLATLGYIDARWPEPGLFGATPKERGRVLEALSGVMSYLEPVAPRVYRPVFRGGADADAADVAAAALELHRELARAEARLEGAAWLATDSISAADVALYPHVQLLLRVASRPAAAKYEIGMSLERYPAIAAWCRRIEAIPGFQRTWPPHWREG